MSSISGKGTMMLHDETRGREYQLKGCVILLALLFILLISCHHPAVFASCRLSTANIMAPLHLSDNAAWSRFRGELSAAKGIGIDAVTVDVWWGLVEGNADNQFDWNYYRQVFNAIKDAGLHIIPIFSFHRCGGGPGDDCNIPVPDWVWTSTALSKQDLQFRSEKDNYSEDAVSVWTSHAVMHQYEEFMNAFEDEFGPAFACMIDELNISLGPTGELRYPSYGPHDGWVYPHRGYFQAYGNKAREGFRNWALSNFGGLEGVNARWNATMTYAAEIGPPDDRTPHDGRASSFIAMNDHMDTQYGKDFIDWYNWSLVNHGQRMLETADSAFEGPLNEIPLGMKIPGVHWQMGAGADRPRIAEITAGLIQTSIGFWLRSKAHGYESIMNMVEDLKGSIDRDIVFHFTALEKDNLEWDGGAHAWSLAQDLVHYIAWAAEARGITLKGENALSGGANSDYGWNNIEDAFRYYAYSGFTLLRINQWNNTAKGRYRTFIRNFRCSDWSEAYFRGTANSWGLTPMTRNSSTKLWETEQYFRGENPRFKICHYTNWDEAYPGSDYPVTGGEGRYRITFNDATKQITADRISGGPSGDSLLIHYKEFEYVPGNYVIHTYNGYSGDYSMSYEGAYDGGHWWQIRLYDVLFRFQFCFTNTNGHWDGLDRTYERASHGNEIWVRNGSQQILLSRP